MKPVILIPEHMSGEAAAYLEARGYEIKYGRGIEEEQFIEDLQGCDGVIIRLAKINQRVLDACPQLRVVAKHGVGVDNIDLEAAKAHNCRVVYTPEPTPIRWRSMPWHWLWHAPRIWCAWRRVTEAKATA